MNLQPLSYWKQLAQPQQAHTNTPFLKKCHNLPINHHQLLLHCYRQKALCLCTDTKWCHLSWLHLVEQGHRVKCSAQSYAGRRFYWHSDKKLTETACCWQRQSVSYSALIPESKKTDNIKTTQVIMSVLLSQSVHSWFVVCTGVICTLGHTVTKETSNRQSSIQIHKTLEIFFAHRHSYTQARSKNDIHSLKHRRAHSEFTVDEQVISCLDMS